MRSGWRVCVLGISLLVGCDANPCGPPGDADGASDAALDTAPGSTSREYVLALATVTIDLSQEFDVPAFGFDLDGQVSEGDRPEDCRWLDSISVLDLDQNGPRRPPSGSASNACPVTLSDARGCMVLPPPDRALPRPVGACAGGVDNQAPSIANLLDSIDSPRPVGARAALTARLGRQRGTVLVRVSGVNGEPGPTLEDPEVEVQIAAAVPAFEGECEASGANREYALLRTSLREGGTSLSDARFSVQGRIRAGRVEIVAPPGTVLRLDLGVEAATRFRGSDSSEAALRALGFGPGAPGLHAVHLRFDLGADGAGSRGNFGAYMPGAEVRTVVDLLYPESVLFGNTVGTIVESQIDVQVDGICATTGPMPRLGGLSVGYGMTFVPARVATPPVVDAPAPGTCAARP